MALKKRVETVTEEVENEREEGFERLKIALDSGDEKVTATVHRASPDKGGPEPYLFSCTPDQLENLQAGNATPFLEYVRETYGTGKYRVMVRKSGAIGARMTFFVERPATLPGGAPSPQSDAIFAALDRQNQTMIALAEKLAAREDRRQPERDWLTALPPIVTAIAAAVIPLKEVFAPKADTSMIEIFKLALDMGRETTGGGGSAGMMDIVKSFVDSGTLQELVAKLPPMQVASAAAPSQPAMPDSARLAPPQAQSRPPERAQRAEGAEADPRLLALRERLLALCTRAAKGSDPVLYADVLMDEFGEEAMVQMAVMPNVAGLWEQLCPESVPYRAWFEALRNAIIGIEVDASQPTTSSGERERGSANGLASDGSGGCGGDTRDAEADAALDPQGQARSQAPG